MIPLTLERMRAVDDAIARERKRTAAYLRRRADWWMEGPTTDRQAEIAGTLRAEADAIERGDHYL